MQDEPQVSPEFSREMRPRDVGDSGLSEAFEATEVELQAIAERLQLESVQSLQGEARLAAVAADRILSDEELRDPAFSGPVYVLEARFEAHVTQTCVVTLEPVEDVVAHSFERRYVSGSAHAASEDRETIVDPEARDPVEILAADLLDMGEAVIEELALNLNPWPRKEGASLEEELAESGHGDIAGVPEAEAARESPFAVLGKLLEDEDQDET